MRTILATALLTLAATSASAQVELDVIDARLLTGWRTADGTHVSGLELTLAPGWKTYWRTPGDAGIPPIFDWSASSNLDDVEVSWPVPAVFTQMGMRSVGYDGRVILPLIVSPQDTTGPVTLSGRIGLGVCEDICIPVELNVSVELAPGSAPQNSALAAALASRPMTRAEADVSHVDCSFQPIADGVQVTASVDMPPIGREEVAVLEVADPSMWVAEPSITRDGGRLTMVTDVVPVTGEPFAMARNDVPLTIISNGQAVEIQGCS